MRIKDLIPNTDFLMSKGNKISGRLTFKVEENQEKICYTLRSELSWSHYRLLMRVENPEACMYYMNEAAEQNWSVRAPEIVETTSPQLKNDGQKLLSSLVDSP